MKAIYQLTVAYAVSINTKNKRQKNSELISLCWTTESTTVIGILYCIMGTVYKTLTLITVQINYQQQQRKLLMLYCIQK